MGNFLDMADLYMPFVRHAFEVNFERRMRVMWRSKISSGNDLVDLSRCCMHRPFNSFTVFLRESRGAAI